MGQNEVEDRTQTSESQDPPLTLAQEFKGTIHLIRLTLAVTRIAIALIKLIGPYLSSPRQTQPTPDSLMALANTADEENPVLVNAPVEAAD